MNEDVIILGEDDVEVIDASEYFDDINGCFTDVPDVAKSLVLGAKKAFEKIEQMLYAAPAFINMVRATLPKEVYQAILTRDQKEKIAIGALKLMTKKDGTLMANLVNPKTNRIVSTVSLKSVSLTPELSQAMTGYAAQMQMAQIAEEIKTVQLAIEEVRTGQEYDRLAMAYSCQQKLLQAMQINSPTLKASALMQIAASAEDSRNLLMLSQNANLNFIKEQPESFWGKFLNGAKPEKINQRVNEIRESLNAVNMVSLTEAIAYQELGEKEAARQSLEYYSGYLEKAYLNTEGLLERLDLIDPSPTQYWTKALPEINKKIQALPCAKETELLEEKINE